jgi:CubicO group peptidase (beta-lactamase class C family)
VGVEIQGFCEPRFAPLADAFRANFDDGLELGASLAVSLHGKPVVDLWAGLADPKRTIPWREDTIVRVYSTTKVAAILMTLMCVDRRLLALDAPIARYWPEFAQGHKGEVTVRDALTHRAGVPGFDEPLAWERLADWQTVTARLAAEPHWFGGERRVCYHAFTQGFVLGELIRRVTGRMPSHFFRDEIARPARIDFRIGLDSRADDARIASERRAGPDLRYAPGSIGARVWASVAPGEWTGAVRDADVPSLNGYGNARSVARLGAILAGRGTLDDIRFLGPTTVDEARSEQLDEEDPLLGRIRMGLGFGLDTPQLPATSPTSFHWGGYGGSFVTMDVETGLSAAYAMNLQIVSIELDPRQARLWRTLGSVMQDLPRSGPVGA